MGDSQDDTSTIVDLDFSVEGEETSEDKGSAPTGDSADTVIDLGEASQLFDQNFQDDDNSDSAGDTDEDATLLDVSFDAGGESSSDGNVDDGGDLSLDDDAPALDLENSAGEDSVDNDDQTDTAADTVDVTLNFDLNELESEEDAGADEASALNVDDENESTNLFNADDTLVKNEDETQIGVDLNMGQTEEEQEEVGSEDATSINLSLDDTEDDSDDSANEMSSEDATMIGINMETPVNQMASEDATMIDLGLTAEDEAPSDISNDLALETSQDESLEEDDATTRVVSGLQLDEPEEDISNDLSFDAPEEDQNIAHVAVDDVELSSPMSSDRGNSELTDFHSGELVKLQATIHTLKQDRENLVGQIREQESIVDRMKQDNITLMAENDELKIEANLLRKRLNEEMESLRYQMKVAEEKKRMYEEKSKHYQKELDMLNQKVRFDFSKIKEREKELESKLELLKEDTKNQILSRDTKILDLKRKIDALEFNMENIGIQEQKHKEDRYIAEQKLQKVVHALKDTLNVIEDEQLRNDPGEFLKRLKI